MTQDQAADQPSSDRAAQEPPVRAVVVAVDAGRLALYAAALRMAEVPSRATLDVDEAESIVRTAEPAVLVLDHGLPRMTVFRLYGMVRGGSSEPRVKVLFVGQDGETIPDDLYLPGEPSPLVVAAQVSELVAEADASAATATDVTATELEAEPSEAEDQAAAEAARVDAGIPPPPADTEAPPEDADGREPALAGVAASGAPPESESPDADQPRPADRRIGVWMFRLGMLLLIIGGLLAFIRPETFSLPLAAPPVSAPATPTPAPSPSPAARADGFGLVHPARHDGIRVDIVAEQHLLPRIPGISDVPGSGAT